MGIAFLNRKGDIFSIFIILVILLGVALFGLIFSRVIFGITDNVGKLDIIKDSDSASAQNSKVQSYNFPVVEGFVFFILLGSIIALVITAVQTQFSPVIVFIFIVFLVLLIFLAGGFANIYSGLASDSSFSETSPHLSITNIVFSKYTPIIFAVLGFIILIIMYSKSGGDYGN